MYYTYILYSATTDAFYKGSTADLTKRLVGHNGAFEKATKTGVPWILMWSIQKASRSEAQLLETGVPGRIPGFPDRPFR